MKSTGLIRQIDPLGRVVLPTAWRRALGYEPGMYVELFAQGEDIIIKKRRDACFFCNSEEDVQMVLGKPICGECLNQIRNQKESSKDEMIDKLGITQTKDELNEEPDEVIVYSEEDLK
ncbi:MAG: AbrB/MazE/SpoVT family DNA-binding domain-containing protein [Ruminococcus sp.]|nr:AbrB/MazE/SpoVT family DNA-binding domain-containing protein [Ruminococcus sp.]